MAIKVGTSLGMLNPRYFQQVAVAADRLGFESLWMPETPLFDVFAYESFLLLALRLCSR
jgi:alkanesulfonate monooxygenase SsuD/methylene tetrahydromethanopterin reductase-like flavin-dependent oxidoreductase (luciferase family)